MPYHKSFFLQKVHQRSSGGKDEFKRGGDAHAVQLFYIAVRRFGRIVAQKMEVESVPVFLDEIHGSGNGNIAQIDGTVHVQDDAAFFRYLHCTFNSCKKLMLPHNILFTDGSAREKHRRNGVFQPVVLIDFFYAA